MMAITLIPGVSDDDSDGDSGINANDNCVMVADANQCDTERGVTNGAGGRRIKLSSPTTYSLLFQLTTLVAVAE